MNEESSRKPKLLTVWPAIMIVALAVGIGIGYAVHRSKIENRNSTIDAAPAFTPSLHIVPGEEGKLGFAENPFATQVSSQEPWLEARSTDPNSQPGTSPATTFLMTTVEPVIVRGGPEVDGRTHHWKITFKP